MADLVGIAQVITSVAILIGTIGNRRRIVQVHDQVRTGNGKTLGALADLQEGRRIANSTTEGERSTEQQENVERAEEADE